MCITECNTVIYKIISDICSVGEAIFCTCFHAILTECHRSNHTCEQTNAALNSIKCVKCHLLILLHIFVVCKRKTFHGS